MLTLACSRMMGNSVGVIVCPYHFVLDVCPVDFLGNPVVISFHDDDRAVLLAPDVAMHDRERSFSVVVNVAGLQWCVIRDFSQEEGVVASDDEPHASAPADYGNGGVVFFECDRSAGIVTMPGK